MCAVCHVIALTFTPPESFPSGQFWGIYASIGGVRVKIHYTYIFGLGKLDLDIFRHYSFLLRISSS